MSTINEQVLREALRNEANSFEIDDRAIERIMTVADGQDNEPPRDRGRPMSNRPRRGALFLVAAAAVAVVCAISIPLLVATNAPKQSALRGTPSGVLSNHEAGGIPTFGQPSPKEVTTYTSPKVALASDSATSSSLATKVESTGTVAVTVATGHFESALARLTAFATRDGGFVASTQAHQRAGSSGSFAFGTVVLQVPQGTFSTLVAQVQTVGHATNVVANSLDVTSQFVDLQARIAALNISRAQYLAIMSHTTSIGAILAVQAQLNTLQTQIEQYQGQLKVLNQETTYGSLTVSLAVAGQHVNEGPQPRTGFNKAFHDAISGFVSGFEWLVRLSGPVLFAALCLVALALLVRLAWRATERRAL
jgi:hypothetical protein